jgi:phosphoglycerate dehydrogenase-like enzyme
VAADDPGRVLVPTEEDRAAAPPGLRVEVWTGDGEPGGDLGDVTFYVAPYNRPDGITVIPRLTGLKAIQVLTAGYEQVQPLLPDGVSLYNAAGLHDASTAEMALALILAAQREVPEWAVDQRDGVWHRHFTRSLAGSRVLLVGYGGIGQAIEARLLPFEVEVTRLAGHARPDQQVHGVGELAALLPQADIVVLAVPETGATRGLIGAGELALLPDDALLVNVGRGSAVDQAALIAERGRIRAALDVLEKEPPPPGDPVWRAPGVFFSPHIGGGSATFVPRARRFVAEQLRRWAAGEPLLNPVDK